MHQISTINKMDWTSSVASICGAHPHPDAKRCGRGSLGLKSFPGEPFRPQVTSAAKKRRRKKYRTEGTVFTEGVETGRSILRFLAFRTRWATNDKIHLAQSGTDNMA